MNKQQITESDYSTNITIMEVNKMSGSTGFFGSNAKEDNKMDKQTFVKTVSRSDLPDLRDAINELIDEYPEYKLDSISYAIDTSCIASKLDHAQHRAICVFEKR